MSNPIKTAVRSDGLRYAQKTPGSPFDVQGGGNYGALSCFFCGTHRLPNARKVQRVLGKQHAVCDPPCDKNPLARKTRA